MADKLVYAASGATLPDPGGIPEMALVTGDPSADFSVTFLNEATGPARMIDTGHALIVDVKTGREQPWHAVQVMTYIYALPRALPQYRDANLAGEIVYPTHTVRVPRGCLNTQFTKDLVSLIRRLARETLPLRVPSLQECGFCDITAGDCADRVSSEAAPAESVTSDF